MIEPQMKTVNTGKEFRLSLTSVERISFVATGFSLHPRRGGNGRAATWLVQ
jgi:hypothetical protein